MWLIYIIDIVALATLLAIALRRGVEGALPLAAFVFVLIPRDAAIQIPGLFDLTTQRIVLMALAVMYLVLPRSKGPATSLDATFKWLIVAHIAWCAVSTANSIVPMLSLKKMVSEVLEYYLLFYIFLKSISRTETIKRILFAIVGAIIVSSCFGAIEAYSNWSVMGWFPSVAHSFDGWSTVGEASGRDARVASTFANSILFGAGLTMGIVMTLCLLKTANTAGKKIFLWGGLLLMFLNIYKASSRGPWLALAISLGILFAFEKGRVRRYLGAIAVLAVAVLVIRPGVWDTVANIYRATFDPQSPLGSSYEYRYALKDLTTLTLSRDITRAIWGYGMESFYYLGLEGTLYGKPYRFLSCDSAWLECLMETGYVGLLIIASILFTPAWYAWKSLRKAPDRTQLYFITVMVSYYFMMLSVAMYAWGQTGYILWMVIAVSLAYGRQRMPERVVIREQFVPIEEGVHAFVSQ